MPWADNWNLSRVQPCGHGCTTVSCSLIGRFRSWRYVLIINFFLEPDNACRTVFACQQCNQMEVVHRPCSACICLWETTRQNQMLKWNLNLSTFQRHLKTFLFRKSFPDIIADWHFSGPCGNLNYLGHSKTFWLIDWFKSTTLGLHPVIHVPNYMDYNSFIDPWGMDGWIGHVGWSIADGLTT